MWANSRLVTASGCKTEGHGAVCVYLRNRLGKIRGEL